MKHFTFSSFFTQFFAIFAFLQIANAQTPQTMLNPNNPFLQANVETIDPIGWLYFKNSSEVKEGELFGIHKTQMGLGTDDAMVFQQTEIDEMGNSHNRYQQFHKGYLVEGAEMIEHLEDCKVVLANGKLIETLNGNTMGTISEAAALQYALANIGASTYAWQDTSWENEKKADMADPLATYFPKGELNWSYPTSFSFEPSGYKLTWVFTILATSPYLYQKVFVNAKTGTIEKKKKLIVSNGPGVTNYNGTQTLDTKKGGGIFSGHNHWHMVANDNGKDIETKLRPTLPPLGTPLQPFFDLPELTDKNDIWDGSDQAKTNSAHWAATESWNYFKNNFGRNGWDNKGGKVKVVVSLLPDYAVFVSGISTLEFGISYGNFTSYGPDLTDFATIDIVGHEFTHGINNETAKLGVSGEPGALNESFADIFGCLIEGTATGTVDWILGNDLGGGGIRSISNPNTILQDALASACQTTVTGQPITYEGSNWVFDSNCDDGGVHMNDGVQNRWFFLLAQGGVQNGITVQGIGTTKSAKIAYLNLTAFLTSTSDYPASRMGSINAAISLFGPCSNEVVQTTNAWAAVGVGLPFVSTPGVTINGDHAVCINDWGVQYFAKSCYSGASFSWSFPPSWSATAGGINSQILNVNSFGSLTGSYLISVTSSLGGTTSFTVNVKTGALCHSFCGGAGDRVIPQSTLNVQEIKVHPNPANNSAIIDLLNESSGCLSIFNASGRLVSKIPNYLSGSTIDISFLQSGLYLIQVDCEKKRLNSRFAKIN